jgi:hypothetical protein
MTPADKTCRTLKILLTLLVVALLSFCTAIARLVG